MIRAADVEITEHVVVRSMQSDDCRTERSIEQMGTDARSDANAASWLYALQCLIARSSETLRHVVHSMRTPAKQALQSHSHCSSTSARRKHAPHGEASRLILCEAGTPTRVCTRAWAYTACTQFERDKLKSGMCTICTQIMRAQSAVTRHLCSTHGPLHHTPSAKQAVGRRSKPPSH